MLKFLEVEDANTTWAGLLERLPELKDLVPDCQNLAGKLAKRYGCFFDAEF